MSYSMSVFHYRDLFLIKGWKMHLIGYPTPFSSNMLFEPQIQPQILTNHIRFSPAVTNLMPEAKKITILRNPISQFRSIFEYFHHIGVFSSLPRREKGLELFFERRVLISRRFKRPIGILYFILIINLYQYTL